MTVQDLAGTFSVVGSNQDDSSNSYTGTLSLVVDEHQRIKATWLINETQEQYGYGFYKNHIIVINFKYKSEQTVYKGVVVYKCISKDVLEGFWSEKHGDPNFLGHENCFRLDPKEAMN